MKLCPTPGCHKPLQALPCPFCGVSQGSVIDVSDLAGLSLPVQLHEHGHTCVYACSGQNGGQVALKLTHADWVPGVSDEFREGLSRAFVREQRMMLHWNKHPFVAGTLKADVLNVSVPRSTPQAMYYVLVERFPNTLDRAGQLGTAEILRFGLQIASALEYLHRQGIIHRDLKPSNIGLTAARRAVLFDFGAAAWDDPGSPELKTRVAGAGTMGLSAPEQMLGLQEDNRVDIFAFGATLYSLIAGREPFRPPHAGPPRMTIQQISQLYHKQPEDLPFDKTRSPRLEALIRRCLSFDPSARPESIEDVLAEMVLATVDMPAVADDTHLLAGTPVTEPPIRTRREWARYLVVALAGLVLGGISGWWGRGGAEKQPEEMSVESRPKPVAPPLILPTVPATSGTLPATSVPLESSDTHASTELALPSSARGQSAAGAVAAVATAHRPALRYIPSGSFIMGNSKRDAHNDELPHHKVIISRPFLMAETEVTRAQYEAVVGRDAWYVEGEKGASQNHPAAYVTWFEACTYCNALTGIESGLTPAYDIQGSQVTLRLDATGYRLPTEAEWEYASRAGARGEVSGAGQGTKLADYAWYSNNSGSKTHPVGEKRANQWGLLDIRGNVWEWCWDRYGVYPAADSSDPTGSEDGDYRVVRGGSFREDADQLRVAHRNFNEPGLRWRYVGLRPVRRVR